MESDGSLTTWAREIYSPDTRRREEAARQIWLRFAERLRALVRRRLDPRVLRRAGDDDVVQGLFASYFAAEPGPSGPPRNRAELWRALVHFTMCQVANTAEHHRALRRDVRREAPPADDRGVPSDSADLRELGPEAAAIAREEFARLLAVLPEDLQEVLALRLEGHTNAEIAARLGRVERTVELKMRTIRELLRPHVEPSSRPDEPPPTNASRQGRIE